MIDKNRLIYLKVNANDQESNEAETMNIKASETLAGCQKMISQVEQQLNQFAVKKINQKLEHYKTIIVFLMERFYHVSNQFGDLRKKRMEIQMEQRYGYVNKATQKIKPLQKQHGKLNAYIEDDGPVRSQTLLLDEEKGRNKEEYKTDDPSMAIQPPIQKMLQKENWILQVMLEGMDDRVDEVEQQVVDISRAQQIIAQNLAKHKEDIVGIHKDAMDTENYLERGNEELKKAMDQGSNRRLIVIIFTFVMGLLLLLLHWYD